MFTIVTIGMMTIGPMFGHPTTVGEGIILRHRHTIGTLITTIIVHIGGAPRVTTMIAVIAKAMIDGEGGVLPIVDTRLYRFLPFGASFSPEEVAPFLFL